MDGAIFDVDVSSRSRLQRYNSILCFQPALYIIYVKENFCKYAFKKLLPATLYVVNRVSLNIVCSKWLFFVSEKAKVVDKTTAGKIGE